MYDDACTRLIHSAPPGDKHTVMDSEPHSADRMSYLLRCVKLLCRVQSYGTRAGAARLITIRYSHYNERARWALDLSPLTYTEDSHSPGFAQFPIQDVTGGRRSASPVLVLPDGEVVVDSAEIVRKVHELFPADLGWLYPPSLADEIEALENELSLVLGARSRQLAYAIALDSENYAAVEPYLIREAALVERCLFPLAGRRISEAIVRLYNCRATCIPDAREELHDLFAGLSARLKASSGYLCGNSFTAADLTFAALSWPVLFPPQWDRAGIFLPYEELPSQWRETVDELRSTDAGQHGLRMYARHRFRPEERERTIASPSSRRA